MNDTLKKYILISYARKGKKQYKYVFYFFDTYCNDILYIEYQNSPYLFGLTLRSHNGIIHLKFFYMNQYKIVLVGNTQVGKTCLIKRYVNDEFNINQPTVHLLNYTKEVVCDNKKIKLNIWDTAGQEKYAPLTSLTYRDANAVLMVFALDDPSSLEGLDKWEKDLNDKIGGQNDIIFVVGAKSDTIDNQEADSLISKAKSKFSNIDPNNFHKTSSKNGDGINELFNSVIRFLVGKDNQINQSNFDISDDSQGKCCH